MLHHMIQMPPVDSVLVTIVLLLRQQRSVPAASKVLLQPAIALRVDIFCKECQ